MQVWSTLRSTVGFWSTKFSNTLQIFSQSVGESMRACAKRWIPVKQAHTPDWGTSRGLSKSEVYRFSTENEDELPPAREASTSSAYPARLCRIRTRALAAEANAAEEERIMPRISSRSCSTPETTSMVEFKTPFEREMRVWELSCAPCAL